MKKLLLLSLLILFSISCSFDNKTGIWKDTSNIPVDSTASKSTLEKSSNTNYEDVFIKNKTFNEVKEATNFSNFQIDEPLKISSWLEKYAISTNNISNFSYNDKNVLLSKSFKLTESKKKKFDK